MQTVSPVNLSPTINLSPVRLSQAMGALTIVLALLLATAMQAGAASQGAGLAATTPVCADFEDLTVGTQYSAGDSFNSGSHSFNARVFFPVGGGTTSGFVEVEDDQDAGGTGKDLELNNINLQVVLPDPVAGVTFAAGYYGGDVNLSVNGDLRRSNSLADLDGTLVGGAQVHVTLVSATPGGGTYTVKVRGGMDSFAVGGQEFFVDDLCVYPDPDEQDPPDGARAPDLGDAPDSSNHVGINNTAYPTVNGRFPTVWDDPTGAPSGPRHENASRQAILGNFLSREVEADQGPDGDGANNILDGGADVANLDGYDDGWRNRKAPIADCQRTTLRVRVHKAAGASLDRMYLNVWFDGNRDGDWDDAARCDGATDDEAPYPAYEWIVQDHVVDLTTIPAGGFVDIPVTTKAVLDRPINDADNRPPAWMRFTLSESPAVRPSLASRADGRGPAHPDSFEHGETEDYRWRPVDEGNPNGEPGTVTLNKRIVGSPEIVEPGEVFTYAVGIQHSGGTAAAQVYLSDTLPSQVRLAGRVVVSEVTPSVSPLNALFADGAVRWRGSMTPDSALALFIPVRARPCYAAEPQTIINTAQIRVQGGDPATDEARVNVACETLTLDDMTVDVSVVDMAETEPDETGAAMSSPKHPDALLPNHPLYLRFDIHNENQEPANVALSLVVDFKDLPRPLTMPVTSLLLPAVQVKSGEVETVFMRLDDDLDDLGPVVTSTLTSPLGAAAADTDDYPATEPKLEVTAAYCLVAEPGQNCPTGDDHTQRLRPLKPLIIRWYTQDLGDAPDSSNHFGVNMSAFGGVNANYPTVFDPATGAEQGPRHFHPRPFHLGARVSWEGEADIGPDQNFINNLEPATDQANLDRADDGARPQNWTLNHCRTTVVPIRIFISPQAAAIFAQSDQRGFLNIWLDGNRDGDWADGFDCPQADNQPPGALEHIVIDHPINVAGLGAGAHTINVPTGRVPWPDDAAKRPTWVRVTLSERESNKTLNTFNIPHGDGRGYNRPFRFGETEDYRWRAADDPMGADIAVRKSGRVIQEFDPQSGAVDNRIVWSIEYRNLGDRTAEGVVLRDRLEEGQNIIGVLIALLLPDGATRGNDEDASLVLRLGDVEPGEGGRIVIITRADFTNLDDDTLINVASAQTEGDVNPENNTARARVKLGLRPPRILYPISGMTSNPNLVVGGLAVPGSSITLYNNGVPEPPVETAPNGAWVVRTETQANEVVLYAVAGMGGVTSDKSNIVELEIERDLPIDPISLNFSDSRGALISPRDPASGLPTGRLQDWEIILDFGSYPTSTLTTAELAQESVTVQVQVTCDDPNASVELLGLTADPVALTGPDDEGYYSASFMPDNTDPGAQPATLSVVCDGTEVQSTGTVILTSTEGGVYDSTSGEPLAGATVAALVKEVSTVAGESTFTLWNAESYGQTNPQTTDAEGDFSFATSAGTYQLDVSRTGYQPYRSTQLATTGEPWSAHVPLTPVIEEDADVRIEITEYGFEPPLAIVQAGDIVEWVNLDVEDHSAAYLTDAAAAQTAATTGFDSGALAPGQSYKIQMDAEGTYTYSDRLNLTGSGTIVVEPAADMGKLYLPSVQR